MSAFLDEHRRTLERVTVKKIHDLLKILSGARLCGRQFIETVYKEKARHFSETLKFVVDLGWVSTQGDELILNEESRRLCESSPTEAELAIRIVDRVMSISNGYTFGVADYLSHFRVVGAEIEHRPSTEARLSESVVRNFLIDLRVVFYDLSQDRFVLTRSCVHCYLWANNLRGPKSKQELNGIHTQRDELGSAAERAIVKFEKRRVGERLAASVEHVSAVLPFACYDIKSVTAESDGAIVARYIEVKAVAADSYRFFWTSSEVEAARLLGDAYFLYLLPVLNGTFDFTKLLIIGRAYETVYTTHEDWLIEENVILCQRRNPVKQILT